MAYIGEKRAKVIETFFAAAVDATTGRRLYPREEESRFRCRMCRAAYDYADAGPLPSTTIDAPWIVARDPARAAAARETGKWLLLVPTSQVDLEWRLVRDATLAGTLGVSARVVTAAFPTLDARSPESAICVYATLDKAAQDATLRGLRALGHLGPLAFTLDSTLPAGLVLPPWATTCGDARPATTRAAADEGEPGWWRKPAASDQFLAHLRRTAEHLRPQAPPQLAELREKRMAFLASFR